MSVPGMAVPRPNVDAEVIAFLRAKIQRRKDKCYRDVMIPLPWLEQLLAAKERELNGAGPNKKNG